MTTTTTKETTTMTRATTTMMAMLAVTAACSVAACSGSDETIEAPPPATAAAPAPATPVAAAAPVAPPAAPEAADPGSPASVAPPRSLREIVQHRQACAAYYDNGARRALARAEENATRYPDIAAQTTLGTGERDTWIERCGSLPAEQVRCFTEYAESHRDECVGFLLSPPPALQVPPLSVSIEQLRTLVASLPPPATP